MLEAESSTILVLIGWSHVNLCSTPRMWGYECAQQTPSDWDESAYLSWDPPNILLESDVSCQRELLPMHSTTSIASVYVDPFHSPAHPTCHRNLNWFDLEKYLTDKRQEKRFKPTCAGHRVFEGILVNFACCKPSKCVMVAWIVQCLYISVRNL